MSEVPNREQLKRDELMYEALRDGQDNAITWHLIHVLDKLERGVQ